MSVHVTESAAGAYFERLVDHFFKILPMWENQEQSLPAYLESFQLEVTGCQSVMRDKGADADFITLLSILQYFIDHPSCKTASVRREVFHAISICNALRTRCTKAVE